MKFKLIILFSLCLLMVGCGTSEKPSEPEETAHQHHIVYVQGTPATCTEAGISDSSYCDICGEIIQKSEQIPVSEHTPAKAVVENEIPANCEESGSYDSVVLCSVCSQELSRKSVFVSALGHTTSEGECERCHLYIGGIWETNYYVDSFRELTDKQYISGVAVGTFSNSATNDSLLTVTIAVDDDKISFFIYEYGTLQVKSTNSIDYDIEVRYGGDTYSITNSSFSSDRLNVYRSAYGKNAKIILDGFCSGETVKFHITESKNKITEYNFSIESSNFKNLFDAMNGNQ